MSAYDLRVYDVAPGELDTLESVLRDLALPMMLAYSIEPVGFWSDRDGSKLHQVSRHAGRDQTAANWDQFHGDPLWTAGLKERRGDRSVVRGVTTILLSGIRGTPPFDVSTAA